MSGIMLNAIMLHVVMLSGIALGIHYDEPIRIKQ